MIVLAFLGFTNFSRSLPLNDKLLHFLCFCIATGVFYFIIDVEECVANCYGITIFTQQNRSVRRIWFWRHSALIFTGFTCFFCGGILSEFVQAALPVESVFYTSFIISILKAKRSINTSTGVMFWFALSLHDTSCALSYIGFRQIF